MTEIERSAIESSSEKLTLMKAINIAERLKQKKLTIFIRTLQNIIHGIFKVNIGESITYLIHEYCGFIPSHVNLDYIWQNSDSNY